SSSRATARLIDDFSTPRRDAAAEKLPSSATARKGGTSSIGIDVMTQQYVAKLRILATTRARYDKFPSEHENQTPTFRSSASRKRECNAHNHWPSQDHQGCRA